MILPYLKIFVSNFQQQIANPVHYTAHRTVVWHCFAHIRHTLPTTIKRCSERTEHKLIHKIANNRWFGLAIWLLSHGGIVPRATLEKVKQSFARMIAHAEIAIAQTGQKLIEHLVAQLVALVAVRFDATVVQLNDQIKQFPLYQPVLVVGQQQQTIEKRFYVAR